MLVSSLVTMGVAGLLVPLVAVRLRRNTGYVLAAVFLAVLAMVLVPARDVLAGETPTFDVAWLPALDIAFRVRLDGLALLFAVVVLGVGAMIMLYSPRYLSDDESHVRLYTILTLFAGVMLLMVLADDVLLLYVGWELTTLCAFLLVGGRGVAGARPGTRAFVITGAGGIALLAAMVLLSVTAGTTQLSAILAQADTIAASPSFPYVGALIVFGALTKSAQFRLHFSLPWVMVAITPVSAYLHAATLVKGGVYLLLRFSPLYADRLEWHFTLMGVGLVTAVLGAGFALRQRDLKLILAYSTVSQLGFIIALVGVGTTAALAAAALHTFAHALFKATLFMLVGIIDRQAGSRDIRELSGLWRAMPITATLTALAALSMAGLPPLVGFVSKEEAFAAFLSMPQASWTGDAVPWSGVVTAMLAVTASCLTFAYGFRILYGAFGGSGDPVHLREPSFWFWFPAALPAVLGLALGLYPQALNPIVDRTVFDTAFEPQASSLALWHGFTPALALSAVVIVVGSLLFAQRLTVDRWIDRWKPPVDGADLFDRTYAAMIRFGASVGRPTETGRTAAHLVWPALTLLAVAVAGVSVLWPAGPPRPGASNAGDWMVFALLAVTVPLLVLARDRMTALVLLGVIGFVVALWFLLVGAPDLALTQLLVEILTVVVAVLVLRRLPARFRAVDRRHRAAAGSVALALGLGVGATTYALTGRRERSAVADHLLSEAESSTGGTNVVNTVLVDFRGLDTLGEVTVVAVAAIGLVALLSAGRTDGRSAARADAAGRAGDAVVFGWVSKVLAPVVAGLSAFLLLRGHDQPGGGFIAALVVGAGLAIWQLPRGSAARPPLPVVPVVGLGLILVTTSGLLGYADGAYLRPLHGEVEVGTLSVKLTTSLVFDVGVLVLVVGLVVAALDRLARGALPVGSGGDPR